jgi:hypothetical protein
MYYRSRQIGGMGRKKQRHVESGFQAKFLAKIEPMLLPDIHVYAVPNGGFRLFTEAIRLKNEGVKKGITDLVFLAPKGVVAWLETKTTAKGSRLDDEQIGFRSICLRLGHRWGTYKTIEEGVAQLRAWGFLREGL